MPGARRSGETHSSADRLPAIVFVAFQTSPQANGGIASFVQIVASLDGFRRIVVTDRQTAAMQDLARAGVEVRYLDPSPPRSAFSFAHREVAAIARKTPEILSANATIFKLVRETGASLVHCNDISALWHAALGARAARAKVVFNVRSIFVVGREYGPKWRLAREVADVFLTLSRDMANELDRRVRPFSRRGARTVVIHSLVDLERMCPPSVAERQSLRASLQVHPEQFLVVFVGAVWEVKGQLEFLRSAAPLLLQDPRMRLLIVGDHDPQSSEYCRSCEEAVRALPPGMRNRVGFTGFVADVERYFRAADATILASRYEGLARAMIESLACGTPVVSVDVSSAREMLEGPGTGLVAARGDYAGLAAHLATLASDETQHQAMSLRARRQAVALFDPRKQAQQHEALYQELIDGPEPTRGSEPPAVSAPWRSA